MKANLSPLYPLTALLAALFTPFSISATTPESPNILFITIDDLNDWVGPLQGHPQAYSPNFDRLAARGVTFLNAHTNIPICMPSRTSFMTGLYPENTGVFTNGDSYFDISPSIQSIPQHLANNGYETLGAGKLFHGSTGAYTTFFQSYGPDIGNQGGPFTAEELNTLNQNPTHRVDRGPGQLQATLPLNGMPDDRRDGSPRNNSFDWGPVDVSTSEMPDGKIASWAVEQLSTERDKPFFLGVGFYRPHQPLFAPAKYFKPFDPEKMVLPEILSGDLDDLPPYAQRLAQYALTAGTHKTVVEYGQWDDAVAAYLACVNFIDDQIGSIIDALDRSPTVDNTWIVLLSDHGYHLGEKEHWGKFTPWSQSTRIPMIIVPPRTMGKDSWAKGISVDSPVSLIDIYPTIVELCGIESPEHELDGRSLVPLLQTHNNLHSSDRIAITSNGRGTHSIIKGRFRYTRYFDGSEELYDREADPNEFQNLAGKSQLSVLKHRLRQQLPDDPEVMHFVRYDWLKIIIFNDPGKNPILYEIKPGTGTGGGIGETKDLSGEYSDLLQKIRRYLDSRPSLPKRMTIGEDDLS